jgi:hypothetical protein
MNTKTFKKQQKVYKCEQTKKEYTHYYTQKESEIIKVKELISNFKV